MYDLSFKFKFWSNCAICTNQFLKCYLPWFYRNLEHRNQKSWTLMFGSKTFMITYVTFLTFISFKPCSFQFLNHKSRLIGLFCFAFLSSNIDTSLISIGSIWSNPMAWAPLINQMKDRESGTFCYEDFLTICLYLSSMWMVSLFIQLYMKKFTIHVEDDTVKRGYSVFSG